MNQTSFNKNLTAKEIAELFRSELRQLQRPANEIILDDNDVQKLLKVSKRKLQYLKAQGVLAYSQVGVRSYYLLSDILALMYTNRNESVENSNRLGGKYRSNSL